MEALVLALMVWISGQTGYPVPDQPKFSFLTPEEIQEHYYGRIGAKGDIAAFARPRAGTIAVSTEIDIDSLRGLGVLVHELTHHMQFAAGAEFDCNELREHEAYRVQVAFLTATGMDDPWSAMDVTALSVKGLAFCAFETEMPPQ